MCIFFKKGFLIAFLGFSLYGNAQDVIVKKDGSTILSRVTEVGISEVKYKKWSNKEGPTYVINTSELLSINYENGEKDSFSQQLVSNASTNSNGRNYHPTPNLPQEEIMRLVNEARPYTMFQPGASLVYKMEYRGKQTKFGGSVSYLRQYVDNVKVENGVLVSYVKMDFLNKQREPANVASALRNQVAKVEIDVTGNYHFVHNPFQDALTEIQSRKGFGMLVEGNMSDGHKLTCGKIIEKIAGGFGTQRVYNMEYSDWKVLGEGKLTTPAGTFECLKLSGILADGMDRLEKNNITCWIARGIGIVRYDIGNGDTKYILDEINNIQ